MRWGLWAMTLVAVTLTATWGGQRYFYCRVMDQIVTDTTCCDSDQGFPEDEGRPAVGALDDCFEVRFLDRLLSFTTADDFAVPSASFLANLPVPTPVTEPVSETIKRAEHPIRAGPFSPAAARAQLMVFLI